MQIATKLGWCCKALEHFGSPPCSWRNASRPDGRVWRVEDGLGVELEVG